MKTINKITLLFLLFCFSAVQAQTTEVKKDSVVKTKNSVVKAKLNNYLPHAGQFGIGADATPLLNFIGNMFNNSVANTFNISDNLIYGKYYLTDKSALRGIIGVASTNPKNEFYIRDDAAWYANPLSNAQVVDTKTIETNNYMLSLAYQRYIGESRLRGFYGVQVLGGFSSVKNLYTYGNPMSALNPTPSSNYVYTATKDRPLEELTTNQFQAGGGLIAGFEYFILPQLCIGGEVSLNLIYSKGNQLYTKSEQMVNDQLVNNDKVISPGDTEFSIKSFRFSPTSAPAGHMGLYIMFHF